MRSSGPAAMARAAALVAACLLAAAPASAAPPELDLTVSTTGTVKNAAGERLGFVRGSALAFEGELDRYDVVFVVDVSGSTAESSGADIDGDGRKPGMGRKLLGFLPIPGLRSRGGGDSILAAEVASVRALLKTLDPRTTRAALVSFSGGSNASADNGVLEVPLTSDFRQLREGLDTMLAAGAEGATDMEAGLKLARSELRRVFVASGGKKRPQQHVVLLTDGVPQVPYESPEKSERRAVQMARRMGAEGIRVHAYAVGPEATSRPRAAVQIAERSRGDFKAVEKPGDLPALLPELKFARVEEVRVTPLDVSSAAPVDVTRNEVGDYLALLPLRKGENRVEIYARTSDGREKRLTATIAAADPVLDDAQRAELERLLQISAMKDGRRERDRSLEIESERSRTKGD